MATARQTPDGKPDAPNQAPPDDTPAPGQPEDFPPTGLTVTDSWAATAAPDGTVAADRVVPEPDSLGG
ncbi:hypothetical protein ACFQS7_03190 [Dankookia sp. GCM10030260]|uniref:hypothetical protein n=1 Tax=Dankookia sp. GCM10030260 TaxID=3273390 RepID=UPI003615BE95